MNPEFIGRGNKPSHNNINASIVEPTVEAVIDAKTIIARRAALELKANSVLNLGIGAPEYIAKVAQQAGILDKFTLTVEPGAVGGSPASGLDFGASAFPDAIIGQDQMFDFYDGGGVDQAFLGLAQCDAKGDINVSRFGTKIAGCGGFINITQNAKEVYFCGTFTAKGLDVQVEGGQLQITTEGSQSKFISKVEQITFSAHQALKANKPVLYITERAVFRMVAQGIELIEVAPGIDVERDILHHMAFKPLISYELTTMDSAIFQPQFSINLHSD
jgi:propionate CoA-transferase